MKNFFQRKDISTLQQITPGLVQELQAEYLEDHTKKGWNCLLGILKAMINRAVEWDLIEFNPITKIRKLKVESKFHDFDEGEAKLILEEAAGPMRDIILILVSTGIRRSEFWYLRWRDVNFKTKNIVIRSHGKFSTKSKKIRSIPMTEALFKLLKEMKSGHKSEYVCRPYKNINYLRKAFLKILKKLELKGTLHDLRHTFASHLAMNGAPMPAIKELMGHSDIRTTMIYAHLSPGIHKE
ncbi:MAG: site-specific integrase [candidate division Zixibacteria bacterium]|nr:site-specific integrase [candidate division Zixibacteria bacterium]